MVMLYNISLCILYNNSYRVIYVCVYVCILINPFWVFQFHEYLNN
jgi:hypothetical protein